MTLANIFLIVLFMNFIGTAGWLALFLVQGVACVKLRPGFYLALMLFSIFPVKSPYAGWVDTDPTHKFINGFETAAAAWLAVSSALVLVLAFKTAILRTCAGRCIRCNEPRVGKILEDCARLVKARQVPDVLYGALREPACAAYCPKPAIILSKAVVDRLSDDELRFVLMHELAHIKRMHIPLLRLFDLLCAIHWFNPAIWLARREFALSCEIDSDFHVAEILPPENRAGYAKMLLKLAELTAAKPKEDAGREPRGDPGRLPENLVFGSECSVEYAEPFGSAGYIERAEPFEHAEPSGLPARSGLPACVDSAGLLAFMRMKWRLKAVLKPASPPRKAVAALAGITIIIGVFLLSLDLSISYFPPYSHPEAARNAPVEWSESIYGSYRN